jgi:hypothetical protein
VTGLKKLGAFVGLHKAENFVFRRDRVLREETNSSMEEPWGMIALESKTDNFK